MNSYVCARPSSFYTISAVGANMGLIPQILPHVLFFSLVVLDSLRDCAIV